MEHTNWPHYAAETLALRLMGEIRVEWSFAKSEKHTTHTQHTHNTHNVRNKEKLFWSKDFNSRKVKVLVSKSGFSRVLDTIRLLKNLPAKVNHSNKRDSDPLTSLELLQALYTVQRY
ncbi:hypothetical protein C8R45DRAFT_933587 [Mycena sanguinolenta]|nr:hypothetical protein C8R45DRAFT_933587 [Mycena sanguinolenta]